MIRFMIKPAGDMTAIIDMRQNERVVATCPHADEALAIMAYLNGDFENGQKMQAACLSRLASISFR